MLFITKGNLSQPKKGVYNEKNIIIHSCLFKFNRRTSGTETSDFAYFQVVSVLNSGKVVLEPFSSPKRVGPIGNYDSTPENNRGYRLYRMRVKNLLEMYCKKSERHQAQNFRKVPQTQLFGDAAPITG